jgi:glucan 1,3-beta-glucosidase
MNEPRISDANFTMSDLKAFYSAASRTVRQYSQGSLRVLIHDAFWGPGYWSGFNPIENTTSTSPNWLDIDLHNYFAFAPNNNLPQEEILEKICNTSQYLRNTASLSPVLVGEWSLETGTAPNASPLGRAAQSQARRTWFRKLFEAQLASYSAYGWYFWTWKTECEFPNTFRLTVADTSGPYQMISIPGRTHEDVEMVGSHRISATRRSSSSRSFRTDASILPLNTLHLAVRNRNTAALD